MPIQIAQALARPQVRESIERDGAVPGYADVRKFSAFVEAERKRWAAVIRTAQIPPE